MDQREVQEELREVQERAQDVLREVDETIHKLIAEKPLMVLGGTLLAGFLTGRLLGRRL